MMRWCEPNNHQRYWETCKIIQYAYLLIIVVKISDCGVQMFGVISWLCYKMSVSPWVSYFILQALVSFICKQVDNRNCDLLSALKEVIQVKCSAKKRNNMQWVNIRCFYQFGCDSGFPCYYGYGWLDVVCKEKESLESAPPITAPSQMRPISLFSPQTKPLVSTLTPTQYPILQELLMMPH